MSNEKTRGQNYWEKKIKEYKRNGNKKSQSQWCRENNLNQRRFNYWYNRLKTTQPTDIKEKEEERKQLEFIPIEIEDNNKNEKANRTGLEITIGKCKIQLNKGFDTRSLLEIVKVVNSIC